MQDLPIIRLLWPGHWIFHRHPLFAEDSPHPYRELWDSWAKFQTDVVASATAWYDDQERGGAQPEILDPYRPSKMMLTRAAALGVRWALDEKAVCITHDPCRYYFLNQVWSSRVFPSPACDETVRLFVNELFVNEPERTCEQNPVSEAATCCGGRG